MDSAVYNGLQTMAAQALQKGINLTGEGNKTSSTDFQELMEQTQASQTEPKTERPAKAEKPDSPAKKDKAPAQKEEDPVEASKRLQVYLKPVSPEELAQYPAEWLPQVEEGEPIVCIGVRTGANGEDIPILVGAKQAAQMYGKPMVDPALYDVSDPEADAILEATAPGADNSPAAMLEKIVNEQAGQVTQDAVEEANPQGKDDDQTVELIDVEQGSQPVFHDVEAVPVKVGEAESAEPANEADVVRQVDVLVNQAIQNGESTVTVRLNPENLGEVTVEVSMKADGVLNVAISARSDDTRALLERHAANLQEMVSSRTQQSVEVNVQRQQESQQNQNQQNYDGHNGHAQDGQERRQRRQQHTSPENFMQQLRLGLIPTDGEA